MENQKSLQRDSYGKTNFITTINDVDIKCVKEENKELDKALQELSDSLDESYKIFNMNEYFSRQS